MGAGNRDRNEAPRMIKLLYRLEEACMALNLLCIRTSRAKAPVVSTGLHRGWGPCRTDLIEGIVNRWRSTAARVDGVRARDTTGPSL